MGIYENHVEFGLLSAYAFYLRHRRKKLNWAAVIDSAGRYGPGLQADLCMAMAIELGREANTMGTTTGRLETRVTLRRTVTTDHDVIISGYPRTSVVNDFTDTVSAADCFSDIFIAADDYGLNIIAHDVVGRDEASSFEVLDVETVKQHHA